MILQVASTTQIPSSFAVEFRVTLAVDCQHRPCKNGGSCQNIPEIGTFYCHCKSGWVGKTCDVALGTFHNVTIFPLYIASRQTKCEQTSCSTYSTRSKTSKLPTSRCSWCFVFLTTARGHQLISSLELLCHALPKFVVICRVHSSQVKAVCHATLALVDLLHKVGYLADPNYTINFASRDCFTRKNSTNTCQNWWSINHFWESQYNYSFAQSYEQTNGFV